MESLFPGLAALLAQLDWVRILVLVLAVPTMFALVFVLIGIVTWTLYLAIMRVAEVKAAGKLPPGTLPFAYLVLAVGYLIDFIFNVLATVPFLEFPREWLFSGRVSRHAFQDTWRGRMAKWFCATLLDPFDPSGCHCRE